MEGTNKRDDKIKIKEREERRGRQREGRRENKLRKGRMEQK